MRIRSTTLAVLGLLAMGGPLRGQSSELPVRVMLFGDATFTETERDQSEGFSLGQVVGHMNAALSPRLAVFVEGTLTPTSSNPSATLERVILRYDFHDWLKLSAGRYHNPVSWWNTAFHHGSWLQPSIARPRMVAFGSPLIPIHFLGLLAEGALHAGPLVLVYEGGVGNGRQDDIALTGDAGDDDSHLALVGGLRLRTLTTHGAEIGVHAYADETEVPLPWTERMLSAHVAIERPLELIGEYVLIRHEPGQAATPGPARDTHAWYAHAGLRLPAPLASLRPYGRWERIEPAANDPIFTPDLVPEYEALIAGLRWDFSAFAAIKVEYRHEELGPDDRGASLLVNASFVVPNLLGGGSGPVAVHP